MSDSARKTGSDAGGQLLRLEPQPSAAVPAPPTHEVATLVRVSRTGTLWIRRASLACSRVARAIVELSVADLGSELLVLAAPTVEGEDIILGRFVEPVPPPTSVEIDGQRVSIEGKRHIVLQCGKARLELNADGRIVLDGENITTRANKANRLLGGTIHLN